MNGITDEAHYEPVTFETCDRVRGPFFHGTAAALPIGELIRPGFPSNYQDGRISNHVYFSTIVTGLAAEMATALLGIPGPGHVYLVEPTGPFEDDPNVTNKRFRGNPTKSYRSRLPLRIVGLLEGWERTDPAVIRAMVERVAALRTEGADLIED
jgi:rifampin ADP-ribosylating transferase